MNFELILWNKVFCRMFGLVVIEVMTPSGQLSNINEINEMTYVGLKGNKWFTMDSLKTYKGIIKDLSRTQKGSLFFNPPIQGIRMEESKRTLKFQQKYSPSGLLMFDIKQSFSLVSFCSVELEYPGIKAVERIRYNVVATYQLNFFLLMWILRKQLRLFL